MPILVATGLRQNEFEELRKKEGTVVPKQVSQDGRVTQFNYPTEKKKEEDGKVAFNDVVVTDYITEEEPTILNNIKK
jgi:hypothetical protein